jgi:ATP-dependent helicase/nuclease subunit A
VVAGLGKMFNFGDTKADVILDEQFGLCAQIRPPHTGSAYPSLPLWLARRRQKVELIAEELRLLYVATTRARDTLILTATIPEKKFETAWRAAGEPGAADVLAARSYADWLGSWFANHAGDGGEKAGATELLRWMIHDDSEPAGDAAEQNPDGIQPADFSASPETWEQLERRLAWQYPFAGAVDRPAKTSVTALRRQADARLDEETQPLEDWLPDLPPRSPDVPRKPRAEGTSAADYGVAHHKFLQFVALDRAGSADQLQAEARRLEQERILSPEETAVLDFPALAAFWESDLGRKIRGQASQVHRELRFTARFAAAELAKITGETADPALADDFVVVQGVADLAVILPAEIWLLDFKTDAVADGGWEARARHYGPQLNLYALALSRIYRRPVTDCCLHFLAARITVPVLREQVLRGF